MSNLTANISIPTVRLLEEPIMWRAVGKRDSEMLFGEEFKITKEFNNWAKGVSLVDGYEGYVERNSLSFEHTNPTHIVDVRLTNMYDEPNFKTQPIWSLSFLSRVTVSDKEPRVNGFIPVLNSKRIVWIPEGHLTPLSSIERNAEKIADTALILNGSSYIYGGRSAFGLDCSALVQAALIRNGFDCPRDSDQQMSVLGESVKGQDLQRGDLVYFSGHVGVMLDPENILNATANSMLTLSEPLAAMSRRYAVDGQDPILDVRRLSPQP